MAGTRREGIALAAGLLMLLGGCAQPQPTSLEPSALPSLGETPAESLNGSADVIVAVDDARIAYAVPGCPVTAWLDEAIPDNVDFGTYPTYLTLDDGSRWSTQLVVLQIVDATVTDWSFVLSSPLTGIPGDAERSLVSRLDPDTVIELAIAPSEATITTAFWDSQNTENDPRPIPGTVSVTCR
jgi:hypothetical protein